MPDSYTFDAERRAAAYYSGAGVYGDPYTASPEDPDMARRSREERRRRREERRERVGDVWRELGLEVEAGPFRVSKEAAPRGRRGRRSGGGVVTVAPTIPPAVWIGAAALGVILVARGGGR